MKMDFEIKIRKIVFESFFIILLSTIAGFSYNRLSGNGIPLIAPSVIKENKPISSQDNKNENLRRITLKEAYELYNKGEAVFIDARSDEEYRQGHIKTAMNLPYTFPIKKKFEIISPIPKDVMIVSYCDGAECNASEGLAIDLAQLGYKRVMIFFGGWEEWTNAGYPVEK